MPSLDQDSLLDLHDLTIRPEDDQVIVGRLATSAFVALPDVGGQALELLAGGQRVGEAERVLAARHGSPIDLVEFAGNLVDLGFVRAVDGHAVQEGDEVMRPSLPWLRAEHCRWLFTRPVLAAFVALVAAAAVTLGLRPDLVPGHRDFFWTRSTSLVIAANTAMVLAAVAVHELAHLMAARSLGVPGRFSLGTRLHVLVAQTDVTGLWSVPRRRRYRAYLVGMAWDLSLLSCVVLLLAYAPMDGVVPALLGALALLLVFGLAGQLQLYMRTDVYFVVADLLRAKNLTEDAGAYLGSWLQRGVARMSRRPRPRDGHQDVLAALPPRERRAVRLYAVLMLAGSVLALSAFARLGIPILIDLYSAAADAAWTGATTGQPARLADGLVTLAVEGGLQLVFLWVLLRNRGARVRAVWRRVAAAS